MGTASSLSTKASELARGMTDAGVARRSKAGVGLTHQPEARVALGEALRDLDALVRRAVVDHDDLEVCHRLLGKRLQARLEIGRHVVDRYDDADSR